MNIEKCLNFADGYNKKDDEPNCTTRADMFRFIGNQNNVVVAMSQALLWQPDTAYAVGAIVRHPDLPAGYIACCTTAGTSGDADPTWQGDTTVADGTVKWDVRQSVMAATDEETAAGTAENKAVTPASLKSMLATDEETAAGTAENKAVTPASLKSMLATDEETAAGTAENKLLTPAVIKQILLLAHPVGSYYWSSDSTDPSKLFGGAWEALPPGYTLIAQGKGTDGFGSFEYKAGEKYGERMHKLTVGELPQHNHSGLYYRNKDDVITLNSGKGIGHNIGWNNNGTGATNEIITGTSGSGLAHNNIQPVVSAFAWKRIS